MTARNSAPGCLEYRPLAPCRPLEVRQLYSVHYFEYTGTYAYPGERHDFWEFLYVDKGAVRVTAGERVCRLDQGQIIFHAPGEFHAFSADGVAPDLVVVGFDCHSPAMSFFHGRVSFLRGEERALLGRIVSESAAAFSTPLNLPSVTQLQRRENPPFGGEQLLCAALEELLIHLVRREAQPPAAADPRAEDDGVFDQVADYLERRVERPLTLEEVCRDNLVGRSQLQKLFHAHTGGGVMACGSSGRGGSTSPRSPPAWATNRCTTSPGASALPPECPPANTPGVSRCCPRNRGCFRTIIQIMYTIVYSLSSPARLK